MSQTDRILGLLHSRPEGITAVDALEIVGSFRLAARIKELREAGNEIVTREETLPNGKRIARYVLIGGREEQMPLRFSIEWDLAR